MLTVFKFHISIELKIWSIVQPLQVSQKSKGNDRFGQKKKKSNKQTSQFNKQTFFKLSEVQNFDAINSKEHFGSKN